MQGSQGSIANVFQWTFAGSLSTLRKNFLFVGDGWDAKQNHCKSIFLYGVPILVVVLCVDTVSGPLRVGSHATVTGRHGQVTFQCKCLSQDVRKTSQAR